MHQGEIEVLGKTSDTQTGTQCGCTDVGTRKAEISQGLSSQIVLGGKSPRVDRCGASKEVQYR